MVDRGVSQRGREAESLADDRPIEPLLDVFLDSDASDTLARGQGLALPEVMIGDRAESVQLGPDRAANVPGLSFASGTFPVAPSSG